MKKFTLLCSALLALAAALPCSSRIAAYGLGFDFYGCEIDKKYFDAMNKRFEQQCLGIERIGNKVIQQPSLFDL